MNLHKFWTQRWSYIIHLLLQKKICFAIIYTQSLFLYSLATYFLVIWWFWKNTFIWTTFSHTQYYAYSKKKHTHTLILYRCKSISIRHAFFATMCSLLFLIPFLPLPSICSECSQNLFLLYIESSFYSALFYLSKEKKDYQKKMIWIQDRRKNIGGK